MITDSKACNQNIWIATYIASGLACICFDVFDGVEKENYLKLLHRRAIEIKQHLYDYQR